jgi:hypothetical protein
MVKTKHPNRIINSYYSQKGNTFDLILKQTGFLKTVTQPDFRNFHLLRNLFCKNPNLKLSHMELLVKIEIYDFFNYTVINSYSLFNFCRLKKINFKWKMYSSNKNIKLSFLEKYIEKNWDFGELSANGDIPLHFILTHPDKKWDFLKVLKSRKSTLEIAKMLKDKVIYDSLKSIIQEKNKKEQKELIKRYKQSSLEEVLSYNFYTPLEYFIENSDSLKLSWVSISSNVNITIDFARAFQDKLNWYLVSSNSKIDMKTVSQNFDLPWNWFGLSKNPNLNIEFLLSHQNQKWDWFWVSQNRGIKMADIINNLNLSWDWYHGVSVNPNLTTEAIFKFTGLNLNWKEISCHPNVDMDFIENNRYFPLYHTYISENPNLTLEFISKNKGTWNLYSILKNKFLHDNSCIQFQKILRDSIKKRREIVKKIPLQVGEDIKKVILFYIGP